MPSSKKMLEPHEATTVTGRVGAVICDMLALDDPPPFVLVFLTPNDDPCDECGKIHDGGVFQAITNFEDLNVIPEFISDFLDVADVVTPDIVEGETIQ